MTIYLGRPQGSFDSHDPTIGSALKSYAVRPKYSCHFPELGLVYITAAATNNTQFFL
jgi:hypothetical protein